MNSCDNTPMSTNPKVSLSNNQLGFMLALFAVFSQAKDGISSWAVGKARQAEVNSKVEAMGKTIEETSLALASALKDLEKLRGEVKAEVNRSFESDQGTQRMVDHLSDSFDEVMKLSISQAIKQGASPPAYQQYAPAPQTVNPP